MSVNFCSFIIQNKRMIHYKVTLTVAERERLKAIMSKGKHTSQQFRNACILLNCDGGKHGRPFSNEQIAEMLQVNTKTVECIFLPCGPIVPVMKTHLLESSNCKSLYKLKDTL